MGNLFEQDEKNIDRRKRRRFFTILKKIERISAVVLVWLFGAAVLYAIYSAAFLRPFFKLEDIEVKGTLKALTKEAVVEQSGIKMGDHLLRIPVSEVQSKLAENPWVKEVAVHRKFPNMVWIYITENVPEAIVRANGWYYVDRIGDIFKKLDSNDNRNFVVITGLEDITGEDASSELKSKIVELLRVKKLYEESSMGEIYGISEVHYDANKGVSIVTMIDPMELRLGFGPFMEKIDRLQTVYPAIRSHGGLVAYIDLNSEGKVVVKYGA